MENKIKFIIIGLISVLVISFLITLQTYSAKTSLLKEREDLKRENLSLANKIEEGIQDARRFQDRVSALNIDVDRAIREKEELQSKYNVLVKTRDQILEELKSARTKREAPAEVQAQPQLGDTYWAGILKAKTDLEFQLENIRNELKDIRINNEQLQREKATLDLEANSLNREKQDLQRQLEYNQKLMDSIAQELVREKNDKFQIHDNLKLIRNENALLRRQLKSLNNRKISLERKLSEIQKNKEGRQQAQVSKMQGQSVELPPIVVRPKAEAETAALEVTETKEGSVLAINRENNFVIIDLGQEWGVKVGDTFRVYREEKPIADIEVIQVRQEIAACDIKKETTPIKVGDIVR